MVGDPFPFGIEKNRKALEAITQFAFDQKMVPRKYSVEELFACRAERPARPKLTDVRRFGRIAQPRLRQCRAEKPDIQGWRDAMAELKKVKASMMNAVHDLPLLVARDEGFFRDEGLDVDILVTPGSGQHNSDDRALKDDIFKRGLEASYDQGQCDQFRMCEWGIMKRAVETIQDKNLRPAKIVALGSAMSSFAIVVDPSPASTSPSN